ncbi:putative EF-hand domain-containing protein [Helianthus annuus]|nr:putative EF-hand domain-containing protein [Helianthus annuus]
MIRVQHLESLIMGDRSAKLEAQILEAIIQRESKGTSIKSINRIILKFPKIDENLRKCKNEDKSGAIDLKELKHCFEKLQVKFTNEEINEIFMTNRAWESRIWEATFETLVESFVFLDSNKDGHVSKNEMIRAIEETKQSEGQIAIKDLMDWDKNGTVNFKEFLFCFYLGGSESRMTKKTSETLVEDSMLSLEEGNHECMG